MALRVNSNIAAINALRQLRQTDGVQRQSMERLSSGLRINRASDDPSGLVISEQLRRQVTSMGQALDNSQNASNLIGTTEAALNEVNSLLIKIRESVVFALNTGGNSPEQVDAEQDSVDNMIQSIDRIAQTTSFANTRLLDGSSDIKTASTTGSAIKELTVQSVQFDGNSQLSFTVNITAQASQATVLTSAFTQASNGTVIRITGNLGTEDITLGSNAASTTDFDNAVNSYTGTTGVYASSGFLYSVDYGEDATVSLEVVSGQLDIGGGTSYTSASSVLSDEGVDVTAYLNGAEASADGNTIRVVSNFFTGDIVLEDESDSSSDTSFMIKKSGLVFQLNDDVAMSDRERIGIRSTDSSYLGKPTQSVKGVNGSTLTIGGFLSSLQSGGSNDLTNNPENALRIVDSAIDDISDLRAYLGAFKAQTIDTNINSLSVAMENLTASESAIRDLDFAQETTQFTRSQILFQSGIAVLSQANLISQNVLTLLNG